MKSLLLFVSCIVSLSAFAQTNCDVPSISWQPTAVNPNNHVIYLSDSLNMNINGNQIEIGDFVGLFYTDNDGNLKCSDYAEWLGSALDLFAYSDELDTPEKDGFVAGEELTLLCWQTSSGTDVVLNSEFAPAGTFSNVNNAEGIYMHNGISVVSGVGFEGTGPSTIQLSVLLQGAYIGNQTLSTALNPFIPNAQPYNTFPWFYDGSENLSTIPENMVDWVLVEARSGTPGGTEANMTTNEIQAGILLDNGKIIGINDDKGLTFNNLEWGEDYYFIVRHRNHMAVLSHNPFKAAGNACYDFSSDVNMAFGAFQQNESEDGYAMMLVGEFIGDGVIQVSDYDKWFELPAAINVYSPADANLDGIIQVSDYDQWFKNKARVGVPEIQY